MNNEITLKEMQQIELNLLLKFKKLCEENNLHYLLYGGTLLGAIRHKGFIPWDDDVDVIMPRNDYKKFIELFKNNQDPTINLLSAHNAPDYYLLFAKLVDTRTTVDYFGVRKINNLGVSMDIFPLDGMPEGEEDSAKLLKWIRLYKRIMWGAIITAERRIPRKWYLKLPKELINFCYRVIGYKKPMQMVEQLVRRYNIENSKYVGSPVSSWGNKRVGKIKKEKFFNHIPVEFCGHQFNAPAGYDEFLTLFYGDYMQLPPEEKRRTHHLFSVYWK